MRRAAIATVVFLLLVPACRNDSPVIRTPGDTPATTPPTTSPTESPSLLPNASCDPLTGGSSENLPEFVDVDTAEAGGIESITFEFAHPITPEPPSFTVRFVDQVVTDGEGAPVELEGEAFLQVSFMAIATEISGETPIPVYRGPTDIGIGFPVMRQAKLVGDFEAVVTWGIGLSSQECFQVDATSEKLTISLASA